MAMIRILFGAWDLGEAASDLPKTAMILAAGKGVRMRPLTNDRPKPLLPLAGRPLLDHALDRLAAVGVGRVVVNIHYKPEMIRAHLGGRRSPEILFSDESAELLETGGGVARALPHLGTAPFYVVNSDAPWLDDGEDSLLRLARRFDPVRMQALLLLHPRDSAIGYDGAGDFDMADDGRLTRRAPGGTAAYVFTGVQILRPDLFAGAPEGPFSLNLLYDRAAAQGALFGLRHDGQWMSINTPDGLAAAEQVFAQRKRR